MEHSKDSVSDRDKGLMNSNSFEAPKPDVEAEKKPDKKKKRHLVLVEAPVEAEGPKKTEQAAGQPKPPEQLFKPKAAEEEEAKAPPRRPELFVIPGVEKPKEKEEAPEIPEAEALPETDETTKEAPSKPEATEADDTTPELEDEETPVVLSEYVSAAKPALEQELAELPEGSPEVPEVLANVVYLNALAEAADKGEPMDEAAIDDIFDQTAEVLDLDPAELSQAEAAEPDEETPEDEDFDAEEASEQLPGDTGQEAEAEEEEEDPFTSSTANAGSPPVTPAASPVSSATPVSPVATGTPMGGLPVPPVPGGGGGGLPPFIPGGPGGPLNPNLLGAAAPNLPNILKPTSAERRKQRKKEFKKVALAAGVGYLIGRRRGRIKTEERLVPVQRKLEREVKHLQEKVSIHEDRIRKLAARKVERDPARGPQVIAEAAAIPFVARIGRPAPAETAPRPEAPAPPEPEQNRADEAAEAPAYREREIVYAQRHPEKLGKFVVGTPERAAVLAPAAAETVARAFESPADSTEIRPDKVETLTVPQLVEVAAKVTIGGVSAEQLFRSERLDTPGLRKVVAEYVRGGNPERVLDQQLKIVEARRAQSIEYLRPGGTKPDDAGAQIGGGGGGGVQPGAVQPHPLFPQPTAANQPQTAQHTPLSHPDPTQQQHKAQNTAQITAAITITAIGAALLLLLLL